MELDIGKMIRFHRKKSGLSINDLATLAGIGKTALYDLEHGKNTVRLTTLVKTLHALNIRMDFTGPLMNEYREKGNA